MAISSFLPSNRPNVPGIASLTNRPQYIIKAGSGNIAFHSMLELGVEESSNLPEEPIEKGSFADYNRTIKPITINCRLASQGSLLTLQVMIERLQELKMSTEKLTLITPMMAYENFMLESFDYRKDEHTGYNVLIVDIRLKEIREIEGQKTTTSVTEPEPPPVTNDASADGSCVSTEDCGEVQAGSPSSDEDSSAESSGGGNSSILHDIFGKL